MAFTVTGSIAQAGDPIYYESAFRNHVESHLNLLRILNPTRHTAPPEAVFQFEGNLFGYLASIGQPAQYHWVIMRLNHYHNPHEFGREVREIAKPIDGVVLLIPDRDLLAKIRSLYLSIKK